MIKPIVVIVASALLVGVTSVAGLYDDQDCVQDAVNFLSEVPVTKDIKSLVSASRKFYRDFMDLIRAGDNLRIGYKEAMVKKSRKVQSCDKIMSDLANLESLYGECDGVLEGKNMDAVKEIFRRAPDGKKLFEAYRVCKVAEQSEQEMCLEESVDILLKVPVDESVEKLVDAWREVYPTLQTYLMDFNHWNRRKEELVSQYANKRLPGCNKISKIVNKLWDGCLGKIVSQNYDGPMTIVHFRPETENILQAYYSCVSIR